MKTSIKIIAVALLFAADFTLSKHVQRQAFRQSSITNDLAEDFCEDQMWKAERRNDDVSRIKWRERAHKAREDWMDDALRAGGPDYRRMTIQEAAGRIEKILNETK